MTQTEQQQEAKEFSEFWAGKGYEKGETARFWIGLLQKVFDIQDATNFIQFEDQVKSENADSTNFIDARIPSTSVMIEQKSIGKDLRSPIKQSDGSFLTPFQQAKRYVSNLPKTEHPSWIVTCNFEEFMIYNMNVANAEPESVLLKNLEKEYYRLEFLVDTESDHIQKEEEVSVEAGRRVGLLYDALLKQYENPNDEQSLKSLNALCVRLVFCLYAEDCGLFGKHMIFHDYLAGFKKENFRMALIELFKMLDTKIENRDKYAEEKLLAFPYVNGGLFADETIEIPRFDDTIIEILLKDCSEDFDWSGISPTIFGAVFESTLNPETRRSGGMHYTSIENIHKVIDNLFLNSLNTEFESIKQIAQDKTKKTKLEAFQNKLANLKFLDPACGSGNFLTETYMSIRRLENDVISLLNNGQKIMGDIDNPVKVTLKQFYGIEINDFAVSVAKTALWIAESQMHTETEKIINHDIDFFPLKNYDNIVEANALQIDWNTINTTEGGSLPLTTAGKPSSATPSAGSNAARNACYDYIMGNPPFVGARLMNDEQKNALIEVFGKDWKNVGNLDFVCAWYKKAFELIKGTNTKCALVSTNSITQGEQVPNLWQPLFEQDLQIDFAYRTFRWDSESSLKAHVHCVIVGFSDKNSEQKEKIIFDESGVKTKVKNINGYLVNAVNVFIESRSKPFCNIPQMDFGNMPNDAKGMLSNFSKEEKETFCKKYPELETIFHKLLGAEEYINNKERFCLWFEGVSPAIIHKMPEIKERIEKVRQSRAESKRDATKRLADYPYLFGEIRQPKTDYIIVPSVSSEKRRYIPIGFVTPDIIVNNAVQIIPDATLYEFGILTSNVHMAWMRAVCGRLKSDYRYSKDIVYNNFPWCTPTDEQKSKIEATAQAILDARANHPDCSLADLYDELGMPPDLRKAHQANDKAVMQAYNFPIKITESECVAELFKLYEKLTK